MFLVAASVGVGRHSIFERGSSNWAPFNSFLIIFSGRLSARKCYIRIILTKQSCSLVKNVHSLDGSGNLSTRNRTGEKVFKSPTFIRSVEIRNKEKSCHTRKNVVSSFSFMLRRSFLKIFFILFEFYSRINNVSDYLLFVVGLFYIHLPYVFNEISWEKSKENSRFGFSWWLCTLT